ncbi:hypothetical protein E2I00_014122 [Balaenoptera physalus]|uniref:Protein sprouty homolog 2 n=1 Tax=Balaenoptera physalus TaxID=9770 RepID=A0A6A1Q5M9_BALPH|nr:hypothetical protein E2I00_014122 [Balaenoptera physalus]
MTSEGMLAKGNIGAAMKGEDLILPQAKMGETKRVDLALVSSVNKYTDENRAGVVLQLPDHNNLKNLEQWNTIAFQRTANTSATHHLMSISTVSSGSRSSTRTSTSSISSEQRLLGSSFSSGPVADGIIRVQPKSELQPGELKPLSKEDLGLHAYRCEDCGKCKCKECTYPRPLPSDWICHEQCLCSAQNVIDYGTCVCCVKGLFYHCSNDDEDNCADSPCSCSQSHCCARWSAMGVMSLFLPCLWCYLPAKGCLKLCQGCYDRVNRPGCRCKNSNTVCCKVPTVPPRNFEKPT